GMTEASHQMSSNPKPPAARKPGSVGPGTGVKIGIMDDAGNLLAAGERGEVVIQGPNVVSGYENNPEANAKSFTNGWFRTGDQGFLDEDGYLLLTGRLKELINRGGEKIGPREIDEVLLAHPAVAEAVCFGNGGMREKDFVDFPRADLLAAAIDELLEAASQQEVTVFIEKTLVARAKPTIRKRLGIGLRIVLVTGDH